MEQLTSDEQVVAAFRQTITPDLHAASDLVDWGALFSQLDRLSPGVVALQALADSNDFTTSRVATELRKEPLALTTIKRLLAVGERVAFSDARELPTTVPANDLELQELADLLLDLKLAELLTPNANVRQMMVAALIAAEAPKRRFRSRRKLEERLGRLMRSATTASRADGTDVKIVSGSWYPAVPPLALRSIDWIVLINGVPRGAITLTFQAQSGGRQQRDLALTYPSLQERLRETGLELVLIADGAGIRDMPTRVLIDLFRRVFACMTIRQAESGGLSDVFTRLAKPRTIARLPIDALIALPLERGSPVLASELPTTLAHAKLTIAAYVEDHSELALDLAPDGSTLQWRRTGAVRACIELVAAFNPERAIGVLAELLDATESGVGGDGAVLRLVRDIFGLSSVFVSAAPELEVSAIRATAVSAMRETPSARFALYLVSHLSKDDVEVVHRLQYQMAVNVIALDVATLMGMAKGSGDPREALLRLVVAASDLAKISPFVLSSVAPSRVYYGREVEEATVTATVQTNSVALLGGRRIGKTSLMKHVTESISASGFVPFFGDCQTVRTWADFVRVADRAWGVQLSSDFEPDHLFELVDRLSSRAGGRVVLLLDEVDQLLDWDRRNSITSVPEAFFRACRGISQEGKAQFVFSGERVIASKLWDAHSPHWNFCRPLPLRQLDRGAAERLLAEPLKELQIEIADVVAFQEIAWTRTSGHPQLLQFVGDKLVHLLNDREPERRSLISDSDLKSVTDSYDFVEQYLETYWGQATARERLVSLFVTPESIVPSQILAAMRGAGVEITADDVISALRLLDLYGVVELSPTGYRLKASWFPSALDAYGGVETLANELRKDVA